jgi:hypothetical protein
MSDDYFFHPRQTRLKHYISPDKKYSLHLIIYLAAFSKARVGLISGTATRLPDCHSVRIATKFH